MIKTKFGCTMEKEFDKCVYCPLYKVEKSVELSLEEENKICEWAWVTKFVVCDKCGEEKFIFMNRYDV